MSLNLAAIRARLDAATPAPWVALRDDDECQGYTWYDVYAPDLERICVYLPQADADFIAHAREDIPALLDHIAALECERDEWRTYARQLEEQVDDICAQLLDGDDAYRTVHRWARRWKRAAKLYYEQYRETMRLKNNARRLITEWRIAAEIEHGARLAAETERDTLREQLRATTPEGDLIQGEDNA